MDRKQVFLECFPLPFLTDVVALIRQAYKLAHDECESRWPEAEARDHEPLLRRVLIEAGLVALVAKYGDGVVIRSCTTTKNFHYRKVIGGGRVALTQSHIPLDKSSPRQAVFREELADHQMRLWPEAERQRLEAIKHQKTLLYAMDCSLGIHWESLRTWRREDSIRK